MEILFVAMAFIALFTLVYGVLWLAVLGVAKLMGVKIDD